MKQRLVRCLFAIAPLGLAAGGCGQDVTLSSDTGQTLCIRYYAQCVDPIFHKTLSGGFSCSGQGTGCHATDGVGGKFKLVVSPVTDVDLAKNYQSALGQADNGPESKLLLKPLLASGMSHGGPKLFVNINDADYEVILHWILSTADTQGDLDPSKDSGQCNAVFRPAPNTC